MKLGGCTQVKTELPTYPFSLYLGEREGSSPCSSYIDKKKQVKSVRILLPKKNTVYALNQYPQPQSQKLNSSVEIMLGNITTHKFLAKKKKKYIYSFILKIIDAYAPPTFDRDQIFGAGRHYF